MIQQANLKLKCQEVNHKEEIYIIIETNNKECDKLIDDLNKFLETLNQSFSQLTKGIRNKYSLVKEKLKHMNSYQINDYLNSTINLTEYKQSITIIIQDQINKLNHSFNNLYEELQLSSFNNQQINDNDVKIAQNICNLGKVFFWDKKYKKALEQLDKSILINPYNKESLSYKGSCLKMLNKYEEAITWFDKALALDPKDAFSLIEKGEALRMLKKYEEAITWLDKALAINPKHVFSLNEKSEALRMLNKSEEAITWLDKAIAIDPKNVFSLNVKGSCLRMLNKYEEAITWFDKALAINPEHVFSLNEKGDCLRLLKQYDKCEKILQQALSIDPHNKCVLKILTLCLQEQQKYQEGLIYYEKSLKVESNQWTKNQKGNSIYQSRLF